MITWNNAIVAKEFGITVEELLDWAQTGDSAYKVLVKTGKDMMGGGLIFTTFVLYTDGDDGMILFSEDSDEELRIEISSCFVYISPKIIKKIMKEFK